MSNSLKIIGKPYIMNTAVVDRWLRADLQVIPSELTRFIRFAIRNRFVRKNKNPGKWFRRPDTLLRDLREGGPMRVEGADLPPDFNGFVLRAIGRLTRLEAGAQQRTKAARFEIHRDKPPDGKERN
ncbi:MAG: hypothetical protein ACREQ4_16515 [Candidatus Binataceae bacterium]